MIFTIFGRIALISLLLLYLNQVISNFDRDELRKAVEISKGVYMNASRLDQYAAFSSDLENTVIVTAANHAYASHIRNYICHLERLGMKSLLLSFDDMMHTYASQLHVRSSSSSSVLTSFHFTSDKKIRHHGASWRTSQFNLMSILKLVGALEILALGYDVLFIDPDVALLRDPVPHLLWNHVDYIHSVNERCNHSKLAWSYESHHSEGNTGFYLMKSNAKSFRLLARVIEKAKSLPRIDDQTIFWSTVRENNDSSITILPLPTCTHHQHSSKHVMVLCPLDRCSFSACSLSPGWHEQLVESLEVEKKELISVHANCIVGIEQKEKALQRYGYWRADRSKSHELHCSI